MVQSWDDDDHKCIVGVIKTKYPDRCMQFDISGGILLFDGKRAHCVTDFTGERYSLVFLMCPRCEDVPEEAWSILHEAGLPVLAASAMGNLVGLLRKPRGLQSPKKSDVRNEDIRALAPASYFPHESEKRNASEAKARSHWEIQAVKDLRDKEELRQVEKLEKVEKTKLQNPCSWGVRQSYRR